MRTRPARSSPAIPDSGGDRHPQAADLCGVFAVRAAAPSALLSGWRRREQERGTRSDPPIVAGIGWRRTHAAVLRIFARPPEVPSATRLRSQQWLRRGFEVQISSEINDHQTVAVLRTEIPQQERLLGKHRAIQSPARETAQNRIVAA